MHDSSSPTTATMTSPGPFLAHLSQMTDRKVMLPVSDGLQFERVADIVSLRAEGNYTHLRFVDGRRLLISKSLGEIERYLGEARQFVRVHRSCTVNLFWIRRYVRGKGGYLVLEGGSEIPVSATRREEFLRAVQRFFG